MVNTPNVKPTFTKIHVSFGVNGESYGWGGGTTNAGKNADFEKDGYHGKVTWSDSNNTVSVYYSGSRHFHGEYQIYYEYPNGDTDNKKVVWDTNAYDITKTIKTSEFLRTISEWKWDTIE